MTPFDTHRERKLIDTNHSIDRLYDGRGVDKRDYPTVEVFKKYCTWVLKCGVNEIMDNYQDERGTYLLHSRSTGIGIVVDWRKDSEDRNDKNNHAIVVTVLPVRNRHYSNNPSDTLIITEAREALNSRILKRLNERGVVIRLKKRKARSELISSLLLENGWMIHMFDGDIVDVDLPIILTK